MSTEIQKVEPKKPLIDRFAERYGLDAKAVMKTLRDTVFPVRQGDTPFSDEEICAGLVLADQYDLNPFAKEIYITRARGKLLVIVPVDGWAKIVTRHPMFDGCKFDWELSKGGPVSCTAHLFRKDCREPIAVTEFMSECFQDKETWKKWPARMLRHKAYNQAARIAFALTGIMDEDELDRIRAGENGKPTAEKTTYRQKKSEPLEPRRKAEEAPTAAPAVPEVSQDQEDPPDAPVAIVGALEAELAGKEPPELAGGVSIGKPVELSETFIGYEQAFDGATSVQALEAYGKILAKQTEKLFPGERDKLLSFYNFRKSELKKKPK